MGIDHSDEVGWPAPPAVIKTEPRKSRDVTTLYQAERQKHLDRHARYRERKRLAKLLAQP